MTRAAESAGAPPEGRGGGTAVFLLNMGGPDSLAAVRPFLQNLFSDPEILRFPLSRWLQRPLAWWIAKTRSTRVIPNYRVIGCKSPLLAITLEQAKALAQVLGEGHSVHVAMRYWHPRADEAVRAAKATRPDRIVVLPLYPHFCRATTGSSLADLEVALQLGGMEDLPATVVRSWHDHPPYLDALAAAVREGLAEIGNGIVLFSAHSVPVSLIEGGDPYLEHVRATVAGVVDRLPGVQHRLAFQSRTGPVRWLEPSVTKALQTLGREGAEAVLVVPVSFVSDHIETLHEIDVEYREEARAHGISTFRRCPSLNVRPDFIAALAGLVRSRSAAAR